MVMMRTARTPRVKVANPTTRMFRNLKVRIPISKTNLEKMRRKRKKKMMKGTKMKRKTIRRMM